MTDDGPSAESRQRQEADGRKAMKSAQNGYLYTVIYEKTDRFTYCTIVYLEFLRSNGVPALLHG
jgi:hypothetical protein